jgi:outer membrane protein insertion porin family
LLQTIRSSSLGSFPIKGRLFPRFALLLLLLLPGVLSAQEGGQTQSDAQWYQNKPIEAITFDGLDSVAESELRGVTDPYIGREFTDQLFLELQRRLYALDYFQTIVPSAERADPAGSAVVIDFEVTERPLVAEIVFRGNRNVRNIQLLNSIVLSEGDIITQAKIRLDEQAVLDFYREQGYPDAQVSAEREPVDGENEEVIVFNIEEGNRVTVREILFSGNGFASESTLRGVMETKAQSIFNRGNFNEATLEEDRRAIERWYRERGFVDAQVLEIAREFERDDEAERTYIALTVFVEEGEQYTFGGMTFSGNNIYTDEELAERVSLREGEILDFNQLEADYQAVADAYYEDGYIYNTITRSQTRNEVDNVISFEVDIVERNRAHIENIIIRGNEKTEDYVLYREIPLEVGDVFSASRIREGVQNLANLQYFSSITPETPQGSVEGLMDLIVNVEEGNTADIRFGVAFGGNADFPISAQVAWQDRNFLGRGQTIGVDTQFSPISQRISVNFLERWLFGRRWSGGANLSVDRSRIRGIRQDILAPMFGPDDEDAVPDPYEGYYVFTRDTTYNGDPYQAGDPFPGVPDSGDISQYDLETDYEYAGGDLATIPEEYLMEYIQWRIALSFNTGYRFRTPAGRLTLNTTPRTRMEYITYDRDIYRPYDDGIRANWNNWEFVNQWSFSAGLDTRDIIVSPSTGYYLYQGITFTGGPLFGDRHYIRTDTRGEQYFTLWDFRVIGDWNWKMVLAAQSTLSLIFPTFWVPSEYRDAQQPVANTTDLLFIDGMMIARGWDRQTDGEALWYNWLEFRMPLAEQIIWFDHFWDAAALYNERTDIGELGIENMLFSLGFGFRFSIPQFPIRLYVARRFQIIDGAWQWQTGPLFNRNDEEGKGWEFVFSIGTGFF